MLVATKVGEQRQHTAPQQAHVFGVLGHKTNKQNHKKALHKDEPRHRFQNKHLCLFFVGGGKTGT